jgi:hypothetical protein
MPIWQEGNRRTTCSQMPEGSLSLVSASTLKESASSRGLTISLFVTTAIFFMFVVPA